MKFTNGIKAIITGLVRKFNEASYMPWATALSLSGRPPQTVVTFHNTPYLPFFGGAVVAVDMVGTGDETPHSRVWLPVMDNNNLPIQVESINAKDITDSISRCKAKSIALNTGVGMSVYAGFGDDLKGFLKQLGVTPSSDLSTLEPSVIDGKFDYIQWSDAYAVAKITDASFSFKVCSFYNDDYGDKLPFIKIGQGYSVAVEVIYKGSTHTEWLSITDMESLLIEAPSVTDWNKTVMRALTKAISVASGYGLNVYAQEELNDLMSRKPLQRKSGFRDRSTETKRNDSDEQPSASVTAEEISLLRANLSEIGQSEEDLLDFLEIKGGSLDDIPPECFERAKMVVNPPIH